MTQEIEELWELRRGVGAAWRWASKQMAATLEEHRTLVAEQRRAHRAKLGELIQQLGVVEPRSAQERRRDRLVTVLGTIGTRRWSVREHFAALDAILMRGPEHLHWDVVGMLSWYRQSIRKVEETAKCYDAIRKLTNLWSRVIDKIEASYEYPTQLQVQAIADALGEQDEILCAYRESRRLIARCEIEEIEERAREHNIEINAHREALGKKLAALTQALE